MESLDKRPRWIKERSGGPEAMLARHRATMAHMDALSGATGRLAYREASSSGPTPKARPAPPLAPPDPSAELAKLADGTAQLWTCSIRHELISQGLVEITFTEDGRWAGDRITKAGRKRLASTPRSPSDA